MLVLAQVRFPYVGGTTSSDCAINTFHFNWPFDSAPTDSDLTHLTTQIATFYNHNYGGAGIRALAGFLSSRLDRGALVSEVTYWLVPPVRGPLGVPRFRDVFTLGAPGALNSDLANQLAVVLSFHSDLTSVPEHGVAGVRPRARRRGRIYLGPFMSFAQLEVISGAGGQVVAATLRAAMQQAASNLVLNALGVSWHWSVFSRTEWSWHDVVGGWVDDRWDIVRRRADPPGARSTW